MWDYSKQFSPDTEVKFVIGSAFGDEGKGVTVQGLCKKALDEGKSPLVIRFSGGPQAAHTVSHNGIEHICSTYGSGVLLGVPTLVYADAYFDPISAKYEYESLKGKIGTVPDLYVHYKTKCITPFDTFFGRTNAKVQKDGTCGKGIYNTFKRHEDGCITTLSSFTDKSVSKVKEYYRHSRSLYPDLYDECEKLLADEVNGFTNGDYDFIKEWKPYTFNEEHSVVIIEGSQGLLLDMDCGFFPNVTPSKVGLNGVPKEWLKNAEVYFVMRTYLTRHGNGYEPTKMYLDELYLEDKHETNVFNQYQGEFKVGICDFDLLNEAFTRHCIENKLMLYNMSANLVVTHFDVLDNGSRFPYIMNGRVDVAEYKKSSELYPLFRFFPKNLDFNKMFINDSVESNLKEV